MYGITHIYQEPSRCNAIEPELLCMYGITHSYQEPSRCNAIEPKLLCMVCHIVSSTNMQKLDHIHVKLCIIERENKCDKTHSTPLRQDKGLLLDILGFKVYRPTLKPNINCGTMCPIKWDMVQALQLLQAIILEPPHLILMLQEVNHKWGSYKLTYKDLLIHMHAYLPISLWQFYYFCTY